MPTQQDSARAGVVAVSRLLMNREIAWAAATDAGNRSMRQGHRSKWSRADYNTACAEFNRLWPETAEVSRA